jgi:maltooligosyltrehalose synthase
VVAVAPRLFAHLMEPQGAPLGSRAWGDSRLAFPSGRYRNVLTGEQLEGGEVPLARLLATFPVALLATEI